MPSGAKWRLYPVNVAQVAISGRLPTGLLKKQKNMGKLTQEQQVDLGIQAMEMTRDVMLNNLVFPKITEERTSDSICIEDAAALIDPEDFEFFTKWIMNGGQGTQNSFRKPNSGKRGQS